MGALCYSLLNEDPGEEGEVTISLFLHLHPSKLPSTWLYGGPGAPWILDPLIRPLLLQQDR